MNIFVDEKEEYYTSKTCTKCGNIDYNLGNKNEYKCKKCDIILERDCNGARNIMLRNY
jgi:putative transposase